MTDLVSAGENGAGTRAEPLLELRSIRAAYEQIEVLHGVDLVVPAASVVALLGPTAPGNRPRCESSPACTRRRQAN